MFCPFRSGKGKREKGKGKGKREKGKGKREKVRRSVRER
jgi:hypothetical protein